jgi:hypothetical protein
MGLLRYVIQGFGNEVGAQAARGAIEEIKGGLQEAQQDEATQDEATLAKAARREARVARKEAKRREKEILRQLKRLKKQAGKET